MSAPDDDVLKENKFINMNHDKSAVQSISADVIAIILITITAISMVRRTTISYSGFFIEFVRLR